MTEELMVTTRGGIDAAELRRRLLAGAPVSERRIEAAGISTAVLEGGAGEPLLLLHGPGEHVLKWLGVLPALVATNRVIAPDLPGHGATMMNGRAVTTERALEWIEGVIDATCGSPPTVVAQTMSGAMAATYAAGRGGRIRRLVLVDTLGLAPFDPAPEFGAALGEYFARPDRDTFEGVMRYCMHDADRLKREAGDAWEPFTAYTLDRVRDPEGREALDALMERFGYPAIPADTLASIRVPVSLIWGRQDLATRLAVAEAAARRYGWPLSVIDHCGDDPVMEQPQRFLEALRRA
ncbi:MAG TPA: alpha/beta fold hydrolase [Gemmatimonadales bacterium]|nr:alpha/beta fold hydrolase [Gemmatimonadales bacterium]